MVNTEAPAAPTVRPVRSYAVRYRGARDDRVVRALSAEGVTHVPNPHFPDVQIFTVVTTTPEEAGGRVSLALDREGIAHTALAVDALP